MRKVFTLILFSNLLIPTSVYSQCTADAGSDKVICTGSNTTLGPASSNSEYRYSWSPTTALSNPNIYNPVSSTTTTRTYTLTVSPKNLITNSDFEAGATSFNTDYTSGFGYGKYSINTNPANASLYWCNMADHSTSGTKMMLADAYDVNAINYRIWYIIVNVSQSTSYKFTGFISNISGSAFGGPLDIDAKVIGNSSGSSTSHIGITSEDCNVWQPFTVSWNSGSNTQATIELRFTTDDNSGNDAAIDDLFFGLDCTPSYDNVAVTVASGTPSVTPIGPITYYYWYEGTIQIPLISNKAGQWYKNDVIISGATGTNYNASYSGNGIPTDTYKCVNACGTSNVVTINAIGCTTRGQYPVTLPPEASCPATAVTGWTVSQVNKGMNANYWWQFDDGQYWQVDDPYARTVLFNLSGPLVPPPATDYVYTRAIGFFGGSETRMYFGVGLLSSCRMANPDPPVKDTIIKSNPSPKVEVMESGVHSKIIKTSLYPNPARSQVTIASNNLMYRIELYNSLGMLVKSINAMKSTNIALRLDNLSTGVYCMKVTSDKGTEMLKLLVEK
jgi:hypothetical protein